MGWIEAADLIIKGMDGAIGREDRHLRLRPPDGRREEVKCSEFGDAVIAAM